jgi:alkylated DNA repair dioxygenase AlkB
MVAQRLGPSFQGSLFDAPQPAGDVDAVTVGALGDTVERTDLGSGAWRDLRPGWISGADELFAVLYRQVPWTGEERWMYGRLLAVPRLQCYLDSVADLGHPALVEAHRRLDLHYRDEPAGPFASADLGLYRDGRDTVPWHADPFATGAPCDSLVALIVLGPPRPFLLRPRGGGAVLRHSLGHGDLIVMGGSCQSTFEHCVPRTARAAGPRIAVQFRSAALVDGRGWSRGAARIHPAAI